MTVRTFLDLSTAHLSPAARAWLSEAATLNHAANYHGTGSGAAMGSLGATLTGWFMHAPVLPEDGGMDCGMPDDLLPIIRFAHDRRCDYIAFDADAELIAGLPVLDEDDELATQPVTSTPMAFEYFEVRPCIETDGEVESYIDEEDFQSETKRLEAVASQRSIIFKSFWTLYGRYSFERQLLAMAIGDFDTKEDAHRVMNAILAPMAKARDLIDNNVDIESDSGAVVTGAERASALLADFINQSSNMERI